VLAGDDNGSFIELSVFAVEANGIFSVSEFGPNNGIISFAFFVTENYQNCKLSASIAYLNSLAR